MGWRGEGESKSQVENADEQRMVRAGWIWRGSGFGRETGLKSQIENQGEEACGDGGGGWMED